MKHIHHDVLIAFAEGKAIQFKTRNQGGWTTAKSGEVNPIKNEGLQWRVKPDLIEEFYIYWLLNLEPNIDVNRMEAYKAGFIRGVMAHEQGEYW
jgi:hypothetical protein